jgi:integrase
LPVNCSPLQCRRDCRKWKQRDLEHRVAHIHASVNRDTGERKSTKSTYARRIPIEAELLPLLQAMHKESSGRGALTPVRAIDRKLSRQLKRCLALAEIQRPELFAINDPTRKAVTFHDLRATGVTWAAVRGDDPLKIKQRAGHRSFSTTEG